jgi:hypothetical protein
MIRALATQQTVVERRLEHLEDVVDRPLGDALADRDGDDPCEPAVFLRGGLEERDGPTVIRGRIDRLAPIDVLDHVRRAVADAAIGHADELVVVGTEGQPHVELEGAVRSRQDPVPSV